MYELTAIGYTNICYLQDNNSVLSCILTGNLYLAIIQEDESTFNSEIIQRVKTYRKNPYTHAVIIDYPVVALIGIAKKYGISYQEKVTEIPAILLNDKIIIQTERLKLPFSDKVFR